MLDLQFICDNLELITKNCADRNVAIDLSRLLELRDKRIELIQQADQTRHAQKELSAAIPKMADPTEKQKLVAEGRTLREKIATFETQQQEVEAALREIQAQVPNLTHPDAPVGPDETFSKVIRTWGTPRAFDFKVRDHVELAEICDLIDFQAGTKVAGHGFYFLKNEAVLLELALVQFAIQKLVAKGFTPYVTPDLARHEVLEGTGYNPRGNETQIYSINGTDLSLVATAEIPLGGSLKDEILDIEQLPIRMAGLSHCFRTEAGAHGRASRGIYRVHQFTKVEMFAFTAPDLTASNAMHEEIVAIEEEVFQQLGIPYQVLDTCSGDLGAPAYRKYDLEAWMPGRNTFGEVTSASNCTDFQSRRLGIRCRLPEKKGTQHVHTLNGTCVAISRALIAVLENYQLADGGIEIPEILRPWVGKHHIAPRRAAIV
ncbi:Serine--tRNA ligase [Planctopirus ephydatiae]|uniref:Serine--tRNA ligase n=1 Tax=Planctopirus ephydatiae TaxID=2528019 RepID=A0A518GM79_9PLAN|nr:serine--tRNA ligase [Planctopirus ephydatiae]QDV29664.1 Serine--tRNA ligase [Planctopirus ephydatiae]